MSGSAGQLRSAGGCLRPRFRAQLAEQQRTRALMSLVEIEWRGGLAAPSSSSALRQSLQVRREARYGRVASCQSARSPPQNCWRASFGIA